MIQVIDRQLLIEGQPAPCHVYDRRGRRIFRQGLVIQTGSLHSLPDEGLMFVLAKSKKNSQLELPVFELVESLEKQLGTVLGAHSDENFIEQMRSIAHTVMQISNHKFDEIFAGLVLCDVKDYPVSHQLHTAFVVSIILPKIATIPPKDHPSCVMAALTMNVGMLALQALLMSQKSPLTDEQQDAIKHHPIASVEFLKNKGVTDPLWLRAVLEHHERKDGKGYPNGVETIGVFAELVSLADVFCAKFSKRSYRTSVTASQAARDLLMEQGSSHDPWLATLLIQEVGVYPPGIFVKLSNGETGLVIRRGQTAVAPYVRVLLTERNQPVEDKIVRDTQQKDFAINAVIPSDKLKQHAGLDLKKLFS